METRSASMLRSKGPVCRPERGQHPLAANNSAYMHSLHRSRQLTLGRHQAQHAVTLVLRAKRRPGDDDVVDSLLRFADKYVGQGVSSSKGTAASSPVPFGGIHLLLLSLTAVWLLTGVSALLPASALALDRVRPWTALTDAWCSPGFDLLARNLFFGYMFGRVVDNVEGSQGLWLSYTLSAAGGSIAAFSLLPRRAPLAGSSMSAALFGLFATATLFNSRKTWHWHRWFELAVLLPFVALQLTGAQAGLAQWCIIDGVRLGNWVPLLGGLAGAALSAALLQLARAVLAGLRQRQAAAAPGAQGGQQQPPQLPGKDDPLVALIGKAATLLLKRLV